MVKKVLCVAEKNDASKSISNLLTSPAKPTLRNGPAKYNKLYCFQYNLCGPNSNVVFTSVSGHLMNYEFPSSMKNWAGVPISNCFTEPLIYQVSDEMKAVERQLRNEAKDADALVIWTDCDREGENIGAEVVKVCKSVKRNLPVYRARFSEITAASVRRAINNLVQMDQNVVDAVYCRMELDLRIGAAFTRLQTLYLKNHCPQALSEVSGQSVISYGSCQFPTLGFVVERYLEHENFLPEPFWKLVGRDEAKNVDFNWARIRLFDEETVQMYYNLCNENMKPSVTAVDKKPTSRLRPNPLDTVALEKMGSKKLKLTAKRTMAAAEKLYMQGFISYPRTETNQFPPKFGLEALVQEQLNNPEWAQFAQSVLSQPNGPNPRNGRKSDAAHPPIHPLKCATKQTFANKLDEWLVYELVTRHFLATCSRDAKGEETKVTVGINGEEFWASGLVVLDEGYLAVYKYDKWYGKQIPFYAVHESLPKFSININSGLTTAPALLTESDLIALMDKHGIGTDATHSEHIEKIKSRQYVQVNHEQRFEPTFMGLALVDCYKRMGRDEFSKPALRAQLEQELVKISEGRRTKDDVLREQLRIYRQIFDFAERNINVFGDSIRTFLQRMRQPN
ncbi:unnamed protein product [Bursaphelenchus xylophilus]|uniref:DNA topoisomerase n=1 Tax=Bursaphelenchus xylophilus TaxID=6326 RepID=A0A1I7SWZ2_BURXY|nr:unnamed protein product [Bursaphelenchus xylophilus]CAG9100064.1 unnamed protein product [Bursaphelenchus xylophilus]